MEQVVVEPIYTPRPLQAIIHRELAKYRWGVIVCHRRFGKTILGLNHLIQSALECTRPRPRYAFLSPTYKQAKATAWDALKEYTKHIPGARPNETELRVDLPGGRRVRLFGCDNPDALRGIDLDGCFLDEYAQMPTKTFSEVIRPTLMDRRGYAYFIGTPKGRNAFYDLFEKARANPKWFTALYRASETGILPQEELDDARESMSQEEYEQELECSWIAAIVGAYWTKELAEVRRGGRVTSIPYDPTYPVDTWWDLGVSVGNETAIWFSQSIAGQVRFIDFWETSGGGMPEFSAMLTQKGYSYGTHYAPHDIAVKEVGSGRTRLELAADVGINFQIIPRVQSKGDSIEAVRKLLPHAAFDEVKCATGLEHLDAYRREWLEKYGRFQSQPLHDAHSNACLVAGTMVLTTAGYVPIEKVKPGHRVITPIGERTVLWSGCVAKVDYTHCIGLSTGIELRATPEHKVMTSRGWVLAGS